MRIMNGDLVTKSLDSKKDCLKTYGNNTTVIFANIIDGELQYNLF